MDSHAELAEIHLLNILRTKAYDTWLKQLLLTHIETLLKYYSQWLKYDALNTAGTLSTRIQEESIHSFLMLGL